MSKGNTRARHNQVTIIAERCKGCSFCIEFCPQHLFYKSNEINSRGYHTVDINDNDKCTGCNICAMICPEFAIIVTTTKQEAKKGS